MKTNFLWCVIFGSLTLCKASFYSEIQRHRDGGIVGIVVQISSSVPEENCPHLLISLKKLFTEGSHVLFEALDSRAWFKSLTIVIPKSWRDTSCQTDIPAPTSNTPYRSEDIFITSGRDRLHGNEMFAQQSRGCGLPGDRLNIPYTLLSSWSETWRTYGDPSKLLVREWSKYRYGIFDEFGFMNDPIMPHYYYSSNDIWPTGISNNKINGEWKRNYFRCNPSVEKNCVFNPSGNNTHIKCSLGSYPQIPSVSKYCDTTNTEVPTKHNVHCGGKSALDIILSHKDFESKNEKWNTKFEKPSFSVVRFPSTQYILLLETSSSMSTHWKWINKVAQKLIRYDLPLDSYLAIVSFSDSSKIIHRMTHVRNNEIRTRLADTLPDKYHLSSTDKKCFACGFKNIVQNVLQGGAGGAHVIIITQGSKDTISISEEQIIDEYASYHQIKISTLIIPNENDISLSYYDTLAIKSGGSSYVIRPRRSSSIHIYMDLIQGFHHILQGDDEDNQNVIVHQNIIRDRGYQSSKGTFTIDKFLGQSSKFGIYVDDEEDHLIKSVTFIDSKGTSYGPYNSMSSKFDIINLKTVNFASEESSPFDNESLLGTQWSYIIEWYNEGLSHHQNAVFLTSQARFNDRISINIRTNLPNEVSELIFSNTPIIFYVQLLKGSHSPLLNATVTMSVGVTSNNGSHSNLKTLHLFDNGNGDPDLVRGDGIYSRYITSIKHTGRYIFKVHVNDNNERAYFIKHNSPPPCCGSQIIVPMIDRIYTGPFNRTQYGPTLHIVKVTSEYEDRIPPARITDLKIHINYDNQSFLASWTAPGDDYDHGIVSGYRFVFSENIQDILNPSIDPKTLIGFSSSDEAGVDSSRLISFPYRGKKYFIGASAFDDSNNPGKISNIVSIYLPQDDDDEPTRFSSTNSESKDDGAIIGILTGIFLCLSLLLWVGTHFYRNKKSNLLKKNGGVNVTLSVEPSYIIQNISQKEKDAEEEKDVSKTPSYWSASSLLKEHEIRVLFNEEMSSQTSPERNLMPYTQSTPIRKYGEAHRPPIPPKPSLNAIYGICENNFLSNERANQIKCNRVITNV